MTLVQLFLLHRYKVDSVHFVTPTEDNERQAAGMQRQGLFGSVVQEVGEIIVADVDKARVRELVADRDALKELIARPPGPPDEPQPHAETDRHAAH